MKGDFVEVRFRTGTGLATEKIQATTDGADVDIIWPQRASERFIKVETYNKSGKPVKVAAFADADVVAIITGHETIKRKRATK